MQNAAVWVKSHKAVILLCAVVVFLLWRSVAPTAQFRMNSMTKMGESASMMALDAQSSPMAYGSAGTTRSFMPPIAPAPESVDLSATNRKVVRNSDVSLLVKDVRSSIDQVTQHATANGGFMVNSSVLTPEEGGTGSVSIRVPSDKLESTLQFLRGISVRVVSENITGSDVTDQFTDTQARLETLSKTKATFEAMLDQASTVDEILRVQQSILQVQDQIDSLRGQLQYLEKTSQSSLISIYLSTDELALPYSPNEPWRPAVIFKTAVRSLVGHARQVVNLAIWAAVYSPILIVLGIVLWVLRRKMK